MEATEKKPGMLETVVAVFKHIPGAALIFAIVPLLTLGYLGWYYYGADHFNQAFYSLKKENIALTQQPEWIRSDVLSDVFTDAKLSRVSLLDPTATASIAQAFENHAWIKSATRVTKNASGRVDVDLVYRHPVAMVYLASEGKNWFRPVDTEGFVLPGKDFHQEDIWNFFHIYADGATPGAEHDGLAYRDPRVLEAILLCQFLNEKRDRLGLQDIVVHRDEWTTGGSNWIMLINTKDDLKINWGHIPERESTGEPAALQKLSRMSAWLDRQRRSKKLGSSGRSQDYLDLRIPESNSVPVSAQK